MTELTGAARLHASVLPPLRGLASFWVRPEFQNTRNGVFVGDEAMMLRLFGILFGLASQRHKPGAVQLLA